MKLLDALKTGRYQIRGKNGVYLPELDGPFVVIHRVKYFVPDMEFALSEFAFKREDWVTFLLTIEERPEIKEIRERLSCPVAGLSLPGTVYTKCAYFYFENDHLKLSYAPNGVYDSIYYKNIVDLVTHTSNGLTCVVGFRYKVKTPGGDKLRFAEFIGAARDVVRDGVVRPHSQTERNAVMWKANAMQPKSRAALKVGAVQLKNGQRVYWDGESWTIQTTSRKPGLFRFRSVGSIHVKSSWFQGSKAAGPQKDGSYRFDMWGKPSRFLIVEDAAHKVKPATTPKTETTCVPQTGEAAGQPTESENFTALKHKLFKGERLDYITYGEQNISYQYNIIKNTIELECMVYTHITFDKNEGDCIWFTAVAPNGLHRQFRVGEPKLESPAAKSGLEPVGSGDWTNTVAFA